MPSSFRQCVIILIWLLFDPSPQANHEAFRDLGQVSRVSSIFCSTLRTAKWGKLGYGMVWELTLERPWSMWPEAERVLPVFWYLVYIHVLHFREECRNKLFFLTLKGSLPPNFRKGSYWAMIFSDLKFAELFDWHHWQAWMWEDPACHNEWCSDIWGRVDGVLVAFHGTFFWKNFKGQCRKPIRLALF